ncbi:MAG: LTA synthase family protein [Myxococcales bacterium]
MPGTLIDRARSTLSRHRGLFGDPLLPLWIGGAYLKAHLLVCLAMSRTCSEFDCLAARSHRPQTSVYLSFAVLVAVPALLLRNRARIAYYLGTSLVLTIVALGDLLHLRAMGAPLSLLDLPQAENLPRLGATIASLLRPVDLVLTTDLLLLVAVAAWRWRSYASVPRAPVAFAALVAASAVHLAAVHHQVDVVEEGARTTFFEWTPNPPRTLARMGLIGFHAYDFGSTWTLSRTRDLSPKELQEVEAWFDQKQEPDLPPDPLRGVFAGRNLLVIQWESLEAFPVGQSVDGHEITPNLNKLLPEALFFTDIHEQVFVGASSDAELLYNTSLYPVRQGATFHRFPHNRYPSLPTLLSQRGYDTVAIHADSASLWNWAQGLKGVGFARTVDLSAFAQTEILDWGLSDAAYLAQVRPMIAALRQPFYAFVVTLSSHEPFEEAAAQGPLQLSGELAQTRMGKYLRALSYTDAQLGRFLDGLRQDGLLDQTVVAVVGDHGGVNKYYRPEVEAMKRQEPWWQVDDLHVPLLISAKGFEGRRVATTGGQVDFMPTLLDLMGVEHEAWARSAMGRNLLRTRRNLAVLPHGYFEGGPAEMAEHTVRGLQISDWLITSRYFERYRPAPAAKPAASASPP